jgi:ATP-binding cassette subfamily F protein uup
MNIIDVSGLTKCYGPRTVLSEVTFTVAEEEKAGIIGANGSGKSTLLRIMAGLESADGGDIARKRGMISVYLPQEPQLDPALTIRQTLEASLATAREKIRRFQQIGEALQNIQSEDGERLLEEQHQIQVWLDWHGAWNLNHKIEEICGHLGVCGLEQKIGELSGGWIKRVALADVLLREPDLLLLDEPTNHLDADTVAWLESALQDYRGAVLLVTHDRYFLDRVVGRMFELEQGGLTSFAGGYSSYLVQKQERLALEHRAQKRLMNLLRQEEEWLHRGAKARTTKQKARIGRIDEMRKQKKRVGSDQVKLEFGLEHRLGGTILELCDLQMILGDKLLFNRLSLTMRKGERIGILGPNGCGKTTLLKTVLGQSAPTAGTVVLGKNTRIGYLDQERSGLDPDQFVHEAVGEGQWVTVGGEKRHKIGYLEDFLFSPSEQRKRISTLSGGERARLLLAKLLLEGANLLILDEPTNDLDIPTLQVLEEALSHFAGCVLVVTHDRYFLDRIATGILHFAGEGQVDHYEGNYDRLCCLKEQQKLEGKGRQETAPKKSIQAEKPKQRSGLSYKERRELEEVEVKIEELENQKAKVEMLLADPSRIEGGYESLEEISRQFSEVEEMLAVFLECWEKLELKKEERG